MAFVLLSARPTLAAEAAEAPTPSSTLSITSTPTGARVVLGTRDVGTTPFSLSVDPGEHRLHFFLDGYRHRELRVFVAPGAEEKAHGSLTPIPMSWDDELKPRETETEIEAEIETGLETPTEAAEINEDAVAVKPPDPTLRSKVTYPSPALALSLAITVPLVMVGTGVLIWETGSNAVASAGGILAVSGVLLGPSAGHIYADRWGLAGTHIGIRLVILFATVGGVFAGGGFGGASMIPALATGGGLLVGDILFEMATTWFAARRARRARAAAFGD